MKRESRGKASLLFYQCFLNAKVGHGNAAMFHFVGFFSECSPVSDLLFIMLQFQKLT